MRYGITAAGPLPAISYLAVKFAEPVQLPCVRIFLGHFVAAPDAQTVISSLVVQSHVTLGPGRFVFAHLYPETLEQIIADGGF